MRDFYRPASKPLNLLAWSFILIWNPVVCALASADEWKDSESILVIFAFSLASIVVAIIWSGLFYRPSSRLSDWLSLLFFYCLVCLATRAVLPSNASELRKALTLIPALTATVWGAAWAWRYVNVLAAAKLAQRMGLVFAGFLFVIGVPLACWLTLLLVMTMLLKGNSMPWPVYALWPASFLALLPGIFIDRRVRRIHAERIQGNG